MWVAFWDRENSRRRLRTAQMHARLSPFPVAHSLSLSVCSSSLKTHKTSHKPLNITQVFIPRKRGVPQDLSSLQLELHLNPQETKEGFSFTRALRGAFAGLLISSMKITDTLMPTRGEGLKSVNQYNKGLGFDI